jgi:hypothetical protein
LDAWQVARLRKMKGSLVNFFEQTLVVYMIFLSTKVCHANKDNN